MSAGAFSRTRYLMSTENGGFILRARVQPETIAAAWNPPVTGTPTGPGSARMSATGRKIGVRARYITGRWTGAVPDGYQLNGTVRVPIMSPTAYAAIDVGSTLSYLGSDFEVTGKTPERVG